MRKVLPYFLFGTALCLNGFVCWCLWRKLSSVSSSASSDSIQQALEDLESWRKRTELELTTQFDRVQSVCGRLDRKKREEKPHQEGQQGFPEESLGLDDQGNLNRVLARKLHGIT